jgi:hypothetical protein
MTSWREVRKASASSEHTTSRKDRSVEAGSKDEAVEGAWLGEAATHTVEHGAILGGDGAGEVWEELELWITLGLVSIVPSDRVMLSGHIIDIVRCRGVCHLLEESFLQSYFCFHICIEYT